MRRFVKFLPLRIDKSVDRGAAGVVHLAVAADGSQHGTEQGLRIASVGEHGTHQIDRELRRDIISIEALEVSFRIMLRTAGCRPSSAQ